MFNGVPDQFHQFIASRTALTLPFPPSIPLHVSSPTFDPLYSSQNIFQPHFLHQLHHQSSTHDKDEEKEGEERVVLHRSLEIQGVRSIPESMNPWSNDEVLALLRTRSKLESWFPDFTWEHVSRNLAELGFKRSAEKCKEKFEEESRYCNNSSYSKNYSFVSELEALYQGENPQFLTEKMGKPNGEGGEMGLNWEEHSGNETLENPSVENEDVAKKSKTRKRKRYHKFELLKGFCEEIVDKMMVQQEELHNKLLEDVEKRYEERVAREEAWKKQEMDRINKEIDIRAHEQAIACDRQAAIIEFLKKFTSSQFQNQCLLVENDYLLKAPNSSNQLTSHSIIPTQNPNPNCEKYSQNKQESPTLTTIVLDPQNLNSLTTQNNPNEPTSSPIALTPQNPDSSTPAPKTPEVPNSSALPLASKNPNSSTTLSAPQNPNSISNDREDHGKRWPRDEVDSLISLRCNLYNSAEDKEGTKAPLWERISQGMLELGYKRSAKRCKEKWENINKYFRKTKDANKKRSLNSKTCPYFHQLSSLYNQGTLMLPLEGQENHSSSLENCSELPENRLGTSQCDFNEPIVHVDEGERNSVQVPTLDIEF
ncbi:hypothetical protein HHK36_012686 [Tetracentron sinense]|uniref:Myb-like domain-containing protein n=1 Tax=Tetracentron sinense TaxID=13715 RepID=A0A834Z9Q5_TETSI|nr:hypothetical protein HHK36_012686 [Tetracentron sinense]